MNENENYSEVENELKHWGILDMHWGIRRFQNPDGSLTPEGRERYLKNAQNQSEKQKSLIKKAKLEKNIISQVNKQRNILDQVKKNPENMSTNELYEMKKYFDAQRAYYDAENNYIKAKSYNESLKHPPRKTSRFVENVIRRPIENFLSKTIEFSMYANIAALMDSVDSIYTKDYINFVLNKKNKNNNGKDKNNNDSDKDNDDNN